MSPFPELWDFAGEHGEYARSFQDLFARAVQPWEILTLLNAYLKSKLNSIQGEKIRSFVPTGVQLEEEVFIDQGCTIEAGAFIRGPTWIGKGCEIRSGCYIRGEVLVGAGVIIGHASELKHCILCDGSQAPHFNYVGDSILGHHAHIGAGVILSNFRLDGKEVPVRALGSPDKIVTGLAKLGALIGDECEIGCNAVLNPGTILGKGSMVLPLSRVSGTWPAGSRIREK